jgi:glycosyltransferase involved in cell wall biosynthesis
MSAPAVEATHPLAPTSLSPAVDVVVPVYNEEADLEPSVRRLHAYLDEEFPFSARITIADNASTDGTWEIASRLAEVLGGVRAERLPLKGRGRCAGGGRPAYRPRVERRVPRRSRLSCRSRWPG